MRALSIFCALALLGAAGPAVPGDPMRVVDPLGGSWRPLRIGAMPVPPEAEARLFFYGGTEYSTQSGCGNFGGTYRLDGPRIRTRQRDAMNNSKCPSAAAARLETALAGFIARAATYALLPDGTLRIVDSQGRAAIFRRPGPVIPVLAGRWTIDSIGRDSIPPRRRARIAFRENWMSVVADCNQLSARVIPAGAGFVLGDGGATEMGCGAEREAFDDRLFNAVNQARRIVALPDGRVRLEGGETLVLRRPPPVSKHLPGSYTPCRSNPRGVGYDGVPGLTFTRATVRDSAGCTGTYRANGALLEIRRDASPACAIPPASLNPDVDLEIGDTKSLLAALRPDAYAYDDEGVLILRTTHGLLGMCREGEPKPFGS
jgi:heat shock protein HslJ